MATPPTIRELLDDPVYRAYIRTPPNTYVIHSGTTHTNPALTVGQPWQVWVNEGDDRWRTGKFDTYPRAFNTVVRAHKSGRFDDIALVSRRVFFGPPGEWQEYKVRVRNPRDKTTRIEIRERWVYTFHWDPVFDWCGRCRRPTSFRHLHWTHHALRKQPCLTDDDPYRCMFCGIRRVALPDIDVMTRIDNDN